MDTEAKVISQKKTPEQVTAENKGLVEVMSTRRLGRNPWLTSIALEYGAESTNM